MTQLPIRRKDLPQDPFLPSEESQYNGPLFLDTEACLCALRPPPNPNDDQVKWQCIGNQTQDAYEVRTGKWFDSLNGGTNHRGLMLDDTNPPVTDNPQTYDFKQQTLIPENRTALSVWDRFCTGKNRTSFSTSYYQATRQTNRNELPIAATPCWRPGAIPVQIQNETNWRVKGCIEGFLCQNNTINSLPQYCPPLQDCQKARMGGFTCSFNGTTFGMGPFEPIICQAGHYCPPPGTEIIECPAGHYCQPGASTPTPCSVGSKCPKKSQAETFVVPIALLIFIDVVLIAGIIWFSIRSRFQRKQQKKPAYHHEKMAKPFSTMGTIRRAVTGYHELPLDNDNEMMSMEATFMPGQDAWAGFQAALDMASMEGGNVHDNTSGLTPQLQSFIDSMRRATDSTRFGLSFQYSGLKFQPKGVPRPILQNVTGSIERGSLTAVMGGSGAGKSTFVNVLMGKTTNTGGTVMINNIPGKIKRYKKLIGYVPQDDIVLPELTVYENILHSARIRLPYTWADVDIRAHVDAVIDCLELSHVRDSLVGSVGKPVISGGQRKRVSIGMELAAAPMAIFLDEPTSGLDATAASSIMETLKALARLGISVIVIIHQPRMEIFEMLDDLILLANGQIIYEGPEDDVRAFFENVGFDFPEHVNLGDVITDVITGNGRKYKRSGEVSKDALIRNWETSRQSASIKDKHASMMSGRSTPMASVLGFGGGNNSRPQSYAEGGLGAGQQQQMPDRSGMRQALRRRGAPLWKQLWLCLQRAMLQQYRAKSAFWFEMGLAGLAGFLLGIAMWSKEGIFFTGLYKDPYSMVSVAVDLLSAPQFALLVAIAIGLVSGAPGVKVFSEEMLLHRREAEAGHSRLAYFLAKVISVFPRMFLACLHFTTLIMILARPVIAWGTAFITNLMYFYCIYGLAGMVSMVVPREDAPLIATMTTLIVGILSGAAPQLSTVRDSWGVEWLWRMSPGVWLAEIYFGKLVNPFVNVYQTHLASQLTGFELIWVWRNVLVLLGIGTAYRLIAYVLLFAGKRLRI